MSHLTRDENIGNFALDVLKDCKYNCTGCEVDTSGIEESFDEVDVLLLGDLIQEVRDAKWRMWGIEIAPTDIMTSSNRTEVLASPLIRSLLPGFGHVTLNCSFLSPKTEDYVEFAKELDEFMPGMLVEFIVPIEMKHYTNIGYMEKLQGRIAWLEENLKFVKIRKITSAVNMTEKMMDDGLISENSLEGTKSIRLHPNYSATRFGFHHGRKDLANKENSVEFIRTIVKQNEVFSNQIKEGHRFTIDCLDPTVGMDYHLTYRAGDLYISPLVESHVASFHPEFKLNKPWTLSNLVEQDQERYFRSLEIAELSPECSGCKFISKCASRDVHILQKVLGTTKCLSILSLIGQKTKW